MITKVDLINTAYFHMKISGITSSPTPDDIEWALNILESMMHEFESKNICTGYLFTDIPDPLDDATIYPFAKNAIETNLAVRLLSAFGLVTPPILMAQASQSISALSSATALVRAVQYPTRMPRGSANTLRFNRWRRYYRPNIDAPLSCKTNKMVVGDINDYVEHFDSYLIDNEEIGAFTIDSTKALDIESSSNTFTDVIYRIKADNPNFRYPSLQQVKIVITTTTGRVTTRIVNFSIGEQSGRI